MAGGDSSPPGSGDFATSNAFAGVSAAIVRNPACPTIFCGFASNEIKHSFSQWAETSVLWA
jgi:hypothetical protein